MNLEHLFEKGVNPKDILSKKELEKYDNERYFIDERSVYILENKN